jgi:hypothetical protein
MNLFTPLDRLFPVAPFRSCGEVVSVSISIGGFVVSDKRKAWYKNASVNAFHMHRSLIRQFREGMGSTLTFAEERAVKRLLVFCVLDGYLANFTHDDQYFEYSISLEIRSPLTGAPVSAWKNLPDMGWHQWVADTGGPLAEAVALAVSRCRLVDVNQMVRSPR